MKVRMRLDIELELSGAEVYELAADQYDPQRLLRLIQSDHCKINGNCYFLKIKQNGLLAGLKREMPETSAARFFVDTPDGVMTAYRTGDIDYPGIVVERKADRPGDPDITLSLTEYIPGGEGVCDYDLTHPDEMHRQGCEVPEERRQVRSDGGQEVSAGFVTRGWPNEMDDPEYHQRIFHYGYK